MIGHLEEAHAVARAQYGKIATRFENLDSVRQQLQSLRDLGDMVDQDDVIKAASMLVGKGLTPAGLAGLLSDMPQGGQPLSSWVGNLWQFMLQREQQMQPMLDHARFAMGTSALQLLAGQHLQGRVGEIQQAQANAMAPQQMPSVPTDAAAGGGGDDGQQQ